MRLHSFLAAIALTILSTLGLSAQSVRVIFVSGQASLQSPGETSLRPVTKGEVVTLGTRIVTGADGRVALTPMPGVKSLITPNTDLLIESASEARSADGKVTTAATLDLKQGAVVTDLIKQEGVTYDYNIRTPRGLAGARGTNYTVLVNSGGLETILVSHGTIVFNLLDGRSLSVTAGQIQITDATGNVRSASSMGALAASDQTAAQEIAESTLNALEAALDAGLTINPDAISQAINLFESFGLDLSASTLDTLARLRAKLDELVAKTENEESTIVTETSTPPATFETFLAGLTPAQAAAFSEIISQGGFNNTDPAFLAKFADPAFTKALLETVNLYASLSQGQKNYAGSTGILGNSNLTAVDANSEGLFRLLAAYSNRDNVAPTQVDEANLGDPLTTFYMPSEEVFFPGTNGNSGSSIFNGYFGSITNPSNLYVGATRYFRLTNNLNLSGAKTFNVATGGDVEIRAADEISLTSTPSLRISFSSDLRGILMEAVTLNLLNVSFPEGSVVSLTSRDGGFTSTVNSRIKIPNFGSSSIGRVNFLGGVYYGSNLLDSDSAFVTGSRGNIAIRAFADGTNLAYPTYTHPPGTFGAFLASLTTAQAAAFADILSLGGFNDTDPAFLNKFSDSNFTSALVNTIDLYISLSPEDRTTAANLGILGSGNFAAIGTNSTGLARLLATYTSLLADTTISAPSFEDEADYSAGTNFGSGSNNVFFNGSSGFGGETIYNAVFGDLANPGDLCVGATRFLKLANDSAFSGTSANFNVQSGIIPSATTAIALGSGANTGGDVQIHAGEGIELAGLVATPITFSADTRTILMESVTINLANVNFPEGSTAVLVSRDGGNSHTSNGVTYTVPNFNSRTVGKVNFLGGVFYGSNILDGAQAYVDGSRGNIAIYSFTDGLAHEDPVYTPVPLTAEQLYMATLTPSQLDIFTKLPSDIRTKLVTVDDTDLTAVMLAVDPSNDLVITTSSMGRYLDAFCALSPQARSFFKTLGGATGSGFTNIDGTPDIVRWSATAIDNAANNFNSMDSLSQSALISLGAGDTIVGLNPDYTTGLLVALGSDLPSMVEAGWGRYLHNLVNDSFLSDITDAAKNATPAQRVVVNLLDLNPYSLAEILENNSGNPNPLYARLDFINSNYSPADLMLLSKVGYRDTFALFGDTDTNTLANINAIIAHYNALTPAQQDAARALEMGSLLIDNTRAANLADFYIGLTPSQQEALRETGVFSAFYGPNPNDSAIQANIVSALNAFLGLNSTIQNYLLAETNQDNLLPILTSTPTNDKEGNSSRSLADIVYILSNAPADIGTLLDMDIAPAILYSGYLDGASPSEVTASLGNAIIFYQSLTLSQQGTLRGLGIMGSGHVGYLGADYAGVNRLLAAYDALPLAVRIDTQRIDETIGEGHSFHGHTSYFFPFNKDTGNTTTNGAMVAVSFESDTDLYVGAVRRLRIDNSGLDGASDTFIVPFMGTVLTDGSAGVSFPGYDIILQAGDLIDLNATPVAFTARGIVMDAITINLSNFDFPEGTVAALNSRNGGTADGSTGSGNYPHWGSPEVGRVNFLTNVTYGGQPLDFTSQFDANSRGNIAIGSHAAPASLPAYTGPSNQNNF